MNARPNGRHHFRVATGADLLPYRGQWLGVGDFRRIGMAIDAIEHAVGRGGEPARVHEQGPTV
jgi:hypothetical protein